MLNQIVGVALLASSSVVLAAAPIIPAPIKARVEQAARAHLLEFATEAGLVEPTVSVTLIPRKALGTCAQNVEVEALDVKYVTRMRFAVVCSAAEQWRAEVIVRGTIKADVIVATADLPAGSPIDAQQLSIARRDVPNAADALSDPQKVAGKTPRRVIRSGQIVTRRTLIEPVLVKRGARVTVVARNVGVEVHVTGDAMQIGHRDEVIDVRNVATGKVLRARVTGENFLELVNDMPTSSASP